MGFFDFLFGKKKPSFTPTSISSPKHHQTQQYNKGNLTQRSHYSPIKQNVDLVISAFESGNIPDLQNYLFHLVSKLNKSGSGYLITSYPQKDRLCECFSLCLRYDWIGDSDIREVWAENGLYCIISYLSNNTTSSQDNIAGGLDLFLHVLYGYNNLRPKVQDILVKANLRGETIFSQADYAKGCDFILDQFLFLGASLVKPYASVALKGDCYYKYNEIINNNELNSIAPNRILAKAKFVSLIIESILNDM